MQKIIENQLDTFQGKGFEKCYSFKMCFTVTVL